MRVTPASPTLPPKLMLSVLASGSAKFELAWPPSSPPRVAYAKRSRGTRLSVERPALLPGENWLPLAQSNSMKVRASPQAVGVRVSKLTFDCCGEMKVRLPLRERAALVANGKTPPTAGAKWTCSGAVLVAPLLPKFVVVLVV